MIRALGAVTALVVMATAAAAQEKGSDDAGADAARTERPVAHGPDRRRPGRRDGARRPVRAHALITLRGLDLHDWQRDPRCHAPASRSRYVNRFATTRRLVATTRRSTEGCQAHPLAPENRP